MCTVNQPLQAIRQRRFSSFAIIIVVSLDKCMLYVLEVKEPKKIVIELCCFAAQFVREK
jgi:hypothetical protein